MSKPAQSVVDVDQPIADFFRNYGIQLEPADLMISDEVSGSPLMVRGGEPPAQIYTVGDRVELRTTNPTRVDPRKVLRQSGLGVVMLAVAYAVLRSLAPDESAFGPAPTWLAVAVILLVGAGSIWVQIFGDLERRQFDPLVAIDRRINKLSSLGFRVTTTPDSAVCFLIVHSRFKSRFSGPRNSRETSRTCDASEIRLVYRDGDKRNSVVLVHSTPGSGESSRPADMGLPTFPLIRLAKEIGVPVVSVRYEWLQRKFFISLRT